MNLVSKHALWALLTVVGVFSLGTVALSRGETINALWIITAAVSIYLVAYRYYSLYIADKVMQLDRPVRHQRCATTTAWTLCRPTNTSCLVTTLPPSPVPVRWWGRCWPPNGYLPGTLWIIVGVVLAGAVQDFMVAVCLDPARRSFTG